MMKHCHLLLPYVEFDHEHFDILFDILIFCYQEMAQAPKLSIL